MMQDNILITEEDMDRLRLLLDPGKMTVGRDQEQLEMLEGELERAQIVSPSRVPAEVVTMNSKVRVKDLDTGKDATYTLVFPRDADFTQGKISVLAPVGTALLGYRTGDVIEWRVPGGRRTLRVEEILFQPEAAGLAALQGASHKREGRSGRLRDRPSYRQPAYRAV